MNEEIIKELLKNHTQDYYDYIHLKLSYEALEKVVRAFEAHFDNQPYEIVDGRLVFKQKENENENMESVGEIPTLQ